MQLSETVRLYPTKYQFSFIADTMDTYISTVNSLVSDAVSGISIAKYTSKDVAAALPSALINQCIRDAKSILKKHYKSCHSAVLKNRSQKKKDSILSTVAPKLPVLKKLCCYINNQNFKVNGNNIDFPVMIEGKSTRISVSTRMTDKQKNIFARAKLGTIRIVTKNNHLMAQVVYEQVEPDVSKDGNIMGVDIGIKCPAVSYLSDGSIKFYGNGRQNKYIRRHYRYLRKKLQRAKKPEAVERVNNKEQRIMKDIDHKLSHDIVATAIAHNVSVIKLEQLANIRSATRKSRKNIHSIHTWSFYRLTQYIEYKARLAGIQIVYVNPAYTSQTCPECGTKQHADDRHYVCRCGFHAHRDIVGAVNICNSTEIVGNGLSA